VTVESKENAPGGSDAQRKKMLRIVALSGAVAFVLILVAVIASMSGGSLKMSDGSDGTADDPNLHEVVNGVKIRDLVEGNGQECPQGATVNVKYRGWLTDGSEFDSTQRQGGPIEFSLAEVIQGWQYGIPGMKVGGKRKVVVSADRGYGNRQKARIPPGSTLIFEVELLSFTGGIAPPRPRRSPPPSDLNKLADGSLPTAPDPNLLPIGSNGLQYRDIKEGDGPQALVGSKVVIDYIGWRLPDGLRFDTSWKTGVSSRPLDSPLANLIEGWQQGVPGMKVGGIRKLVVPPDLAYGARGHGDDIPPNATLVFEIELLAVR
jgi:peptidylprolyl isomerase